MKFRVIALLLIIAVIAGVGWNNSQHLAKARAARDRVRNQAMKLGVRSDPAEVRHKSKVRQAEMPPALAKPVPSEDIAYFKNSELKKADRILTPEQDREQFAALISRMKAMTPAQVRRYVAEVRTIEELSDSSRQLLIEMAVGTLADTNPPEGLTIYLELMKNFPMEDRHHSVSSKFTQWARKDPPSALAWMRANLAEHEELIPDEAKTAIIVAIAPTDRKEAFRLIGELGLETPADATQGIVDSAKTPQERSAAVADLRDYLPTIEDTEERRKAGDYALATLGRTLAKDGFQAASDWALSAGLTDAELASFGGDIGTSVKEGDEGKWVEWLGEKLPDGGYKKGVRNVMMYWTEDDYQAAGTWLSTVPAGPAKNHAITIFAETVSTFEPEAAVQWAMTLPAGQQRDDTVHKIFHNWPTKDAAGKAAAAAFEKEHNIQHDH